MNEGFTEYDRNRANLLVDAEDRSPRKGPFYWHKSASSLGFGPQGIGFAGWPG
jgi:hypothetical protein